MRSTHVHDRTRPRGRRGVPGQPHRRPAAPRPSSASTTFSSGCQWSNVDGYDRKGSDLAGPDRRPEVAAGLALLAAGLSAQGLKITANISQLNDVAGRLLGQTDPFNEGLYCFTFMGTPSTTEPWGFQFEGHHLVINYFVLGDQVVMTPTFMGSEPRPAIVDPDTNSRSASSTRLRRRPRHDQLPDRRRSRPWRSSAADKTGDNNIADAFKDNVQTVAYVGIAARTSTAAEEEAPGAGQPVHREHGHRSRQVKMAEIKDHLSETYFSWIGATDADAVFYFRIQSPVIYIEFDCELPGPLGGTYGAGQGGGGGTPPSGAPGGTPSAEATPSGTATPSGGTTPSAGSSPTDGWGTTTSVPSRQHVHSVVRTPNGNDYGKELLRQHYLTSPHHRNGR